jgi:hypothetical protein
MNVLLTAALLSAVTIGTGDSAQTSAPALVAQIPTPAPAGGGRDGPYSHVLRAGVDARVRRVHGFRADVVYENYMWWVIYYPFP